MKKIVIYINFLLAILFSFALCAQISTKEWEFPKYIQGTHEEVLPAQGCSKLVALKSDKNLKYFFGLTTLSDAVSNYFHAIYTFDPNKSQTDAVSFPKTELNNYASNNQVLVNKDHKTAYLMYNSNNKISFMKVTIDSNNKFNIRSISGELSFQNISNYLFQCNGDIYGIDLGSKDQNASIFRYKLTDRNILEKKYFTFDSSFERVLACEKDNVIYGIGITKTESILFSFNTVNKDFKKLENFPIDNKIFSKDPIIINNSFFTYYMKNHSLYLSKFDLQTKKSTDYCLNDYLSVPIIYGTSNIVSQGDSLYMVIQTMGSNGYRLNVLRFNCKNNMLTNDVSFDMSVFILNKSLSIFNNILYITTYNMKTNLSKILSIDLKSITNM